MSSLILIDKCSHDTVNIADQLGGLVGGLVQGKAGREDFFTKFSETTLLLIILLRCGI